MQTSPATDRKGGFRIYDMPYVLMVMPPLFWAGNMVIGRAVAGAVPPVGLAFWRWTIGCLILLPFAWRHLRRDLPTVLRHWRIMLVLSALGIAMFNTFAYIGLQDTTALNAVMMQSTMPVLIVLASFVLFGERVGMMQAAGIVISLLGVAAIVTQGDWQALAELAFAAGDLWVLAAVIAYALYTALLRRRPPVHPLTLLVVTFGLGGLMLAPFHAAEVLAGNPLEPTPAALAAVGYVALFPSILAYLCFNRAVELIGANRTGLSIHLVPVFGSVMAVLFLGETPGWHHAMGIALIAAGIWLAARRGRR